MANTYGTHTMMVEGGPSFMRPPPPAACTRRVAGVQLLRAHALRARVALFAYSPGATVVIKNSQDVQQVRRGGAREPK